MKRQNAVLVLNVGSSSVKFRVFSKEKDLPLLATGRITGIGSRPLFSIKGHESRQLEAGLTQKQALKKVLDWIVSDDQGWTLVAAGHRIVHGGPHLSGPVLLDEELLSKLDSLVKLAPLHQPYCLAAVRAVADIYPDLPQIGCFDTAFHATHDHLIQSYALPEDLRNSGIRRYGFHGLSYEWIAHILEQEEGGAPKHVVAAHLGNGASLCAMRYGRSVDTTMGMTALEGLPMGTRSGTLDPGAVIYMLRQCGLSLEDVEDILYNQSGLKGLSGGISDMRQLLASESAKAVFAVEYFIHKTAQFVSQMVVSLGGMDLLVFTGGIGENATTVRNGIIEKLSFLPDFETRVITADEERMIAFHTLQLMSDLD